jgi:hypothetical protein
MSTQIFSRSFLQGIPEQRKQEEMDRIIQGFINNLLNEAAKGKTSYMYDLNKHRPLAQNPLPVITNDDLVSTFQKKFPECEVSYQETWIDINSNNRVLKKGIIIDWS